MAQHFQLNIILRIVALKALFTQNTDFCGFEKPKKYWEILIRDREIKIPERRKKISKLRWSIWAGLMQLYGERFYHDFDDAHAHQMALQSSSADRIPIKNVVVVAVTQSTSDGLH